MSARIEDVEQHINGNTRNSGDKPDDSRHSSPLAVFGILGLEAQRQRSDAEYSSYGSQHNVEDQEDMVQRRQIIRSAPGRIPHEYRS